MPKRNFREILEARWVLGNFVCVGLDPVAEKMPERVKIPYPTSPSGQFRLFCEAIVRSTADLVCAYKPNLAFFEAEGAQGWATLQNIIATIHDVAPNVPVIADAKRGDIGNSNSGYAQAVFDDLGADAITVHPYLGQEAMQPFLDRKDKGVIVLCRTSNPGAEEFQGIDFVVEFEEGKTLEEVTGSFFMSPEGRHAKMYEHVAYRVSRHWNKDNNCALVVGATSPFQLGRVRKIVGDMPILIPGIGAQGGDLKQTVHAGQDSRGRGMIINASRSILYASGGEDFAEAARAETLKLRNQINQYRKEA